MLWELRNENPEKEKGKNWRIMTRSRRSIWVAEVFCNSSKTHLERERKRERERERENSDFLKVYQWMHASGVAVANKKRGKTKSSHFFPKVKAVES